MALPTPAMTAVDQLLAVLDQLEKVMVELRRCAHDLADHLDTDDEEGDGDG